jgi:hypothetical protein
MTHAKQMLLNTLNWPLRQFGAELVPAWKQTWWRCPATFELGGRSFNYFYHRYNCGWPPYATERCAELGVADVWLDEIGNQDVVEIGAVTPYYWPGRLKEIVDPFDPHKLVSLRASVFDVDLTGRSVLSVSTLEHVGTGEYGGTPSPGLAVDAVQKIFNESTCFLLTVPVAYNPALDKLFFEGATSLPDDVEVRFLIRVADGCWEETPAGTQARRGYDAPGVNNGRSAAALIVVERGNVLKCNSNGRHVCNATGDF